MFTAIQREQPVYSITPKPTARFTDFNYFPSSNAPTFVEPVVLGPDGTPIVELSAL